MPSFSRVTCRVPGSTSNCGSGFDTLGLALSIYNEVTVERASAQGGERFGDDVYGESEMAQATVTRFFEESEVERFAIRIRIRGEVPRARGLGSSVTVRAGILAGLSELAGLNWSKEKLVELITELEGHPDNASSAILGGFTVSRFQSDPAKVESVAQFDVGEELRLIVVAPELEVLTSTSRGVLPKQLGFADAIASINSASCVVAAMASGRYEALEGSVHDYVHEPYRLKGIPGAAEAIEAGRAAGAYTGWLSGSGSSVLCACDVSVAESVAVAMKDAFKTVGVASVSYDLSADNGGLTIMERS